MNKIKKILLAEDDEKDIELTLLALKQSNLLNEVIITRNGEEALDYLYCRGEFKDREKDNPALILLDIKMPKINGLEVLKQIKTDVNLKNIPTVILTSSREDKDIVEGYNLGVNAYVVKPVDFGEFIYAIRELGLFWMIINEPPPEDK